ncbi:putative nuclear pore complex protein [Patellaria atrata CBS 101060]|uniref:Nuclear pore complex protein n=1 Tax=Patellaria atrata CBS 101060 TaxID=1346257 RepID=A0A9P4VRA2_9PEZI|nr:putative nuclear pore complex protein [Patellaria atrata CBS 101060]
MSSLFGSSSSPSNPTQGDISKDVAVAQPPSDSVSDLAFSPQADYLAVASWDKATRIYEIKADGSTEGKASYNHENAVLSCAWSPDGAQVVSAGADKVARMFDVASGQSQVVAQHDDTIRCVAMFTAPSVGNMVVTGSWDKTIKYWDIRQQTPAATVSVQERVYSMSVKEKLLAVATADRYINIIDLSNPQTVFKRVQSPLKWQTRVVSCFTDATGFAIGSIEGRCAIQYVQDKDASSNFSFKCHRATDPTQRDVSKVYSVNAISFHPVHGTFSTAGSDGTFHFWDKDAKHRLKGYPEVGGSISATAFNRNGNIFAYGISYDWSKGYSENKPNYPCKIMLHPVSGDECKPRPGTKKR